MADIDDAITLTGATTGKVLSQARAVIPNLSAAQKTALVTFIQSLGGWAGLPAHVVSLSVSRNPNGGASAAINGYIVHTDSASAVTQKSSGAVDHILGQVP